METDKFIKDMTIRGHIGMLLSEQYLEVSVRGYGSLFAYLAELDILYYGRFEANINDEPIPQLDFTFNDEAGRTLNYMEVELKRLFPHDSQKNQLVKLARYMCIKAEDNYTPIVNGIKTFEEEKEVYEFILRLLPRMISKPYDYFGNFLMRDKSFCKETDYFPTPVEVCIVGRNIINSKKKDELCYDGTCGTGTWIFRSGDDL